MIVSSGYKNFYVKVDDLFAGGERAKRDDSYSVLVRNIQKEIL